MYNLPKIVDFLRFSFEIIMIMRVLSKYIINKNLSIDKQKNNGSVKNITLVATIRHLTYNGGNGHENKNIGGIMYESVFTGSNCRKICFDWKK